MSVKSRLTMFPMMCHHVIRALVRTGGETLLVANDTAAQSAWGKGNWQKKIAGSLIFFSDPAI